MEKQKRCSKCGQIKSVSDFSKLSSSSDGLQYKCKACAKAYRDARIEEVREQGRQYYADNREIVREKARAKYRLNPEKVLEGNRDWQRRNPIKAKLARKAYYAKNRDTINARASEWAKKNPEKRRETVAKHALKATIMRRFYSRAMQARKRGCQVVLPTQDAVEGKVAYYGDKCYICGGDWECFDHVKPISKGGPHMLSNIKPCCYRCNIEKHAKWPYDWREKSRTVQ